MYNNSPQYKEKDSPLRQVRFLFLSSPSGTSILPTKSP